MSRSYHADDIPDYYPQQHQPRHQLPNTHGQSRIPRPTQAAPDNQRRASQPMRPDQQQSVRGPRRTQEQYYPDRSAWGASQNLYDGSGYEDEYAQFEQQQQQQQWPLPAQQPPRSRGSPRRAPVRPRRPEETDYQQPVPRQNRTGVNVAAHRGYTDHHGNGQWTGDGYSYASQPNFPMPRSTAMPQYVEDDWQRDVGGNFGPQPPQQATTTYSQANRRAPLGPPPSARRGPSSYYPQNGPVHPIVEETDSMRSSTRNASSIHTAGHESKNSFASSNAIPIGIPQGILDNHADRRPNTRDHLPTPEESDPDDAPTDAVTAGQRPNRFDPSPPALEQASPEVMVRKASLGKKSKPTLTTVKTGDKVRKASAAGLASLPSQQHSRQQPWGVQSTAPDTQRSRAVTHARTGGEAQPGANSSDETAVDADIAVLAPDPESRRAHERAESRTPEEILKSGTGLLDASSSESENEVKRTRSKELLGPATASEPQPERASPRSPLVPDDDDERVKSILESLEKGGAISAEEAEELKKPMAGLSERPGRRRPPRLNVDAVRDAEARGSLTSLPDLIKRATKLASNLDRGRTASRLGPHWMDGADEKRRSGNLSDMLAAFPPPLATPSGSRNERRSLTNWSSRLRHSALPSNSDAGDVRKGGRRCCGIPLWSFVLLIFLVFLLVVAAILVPVILLVVVPDSNHHSANHAGSCEQKLSCQNGGVSILSSSGTCQCLCVNGYTGLNCTDHTERGCTTTRIGSASNATVGSAIPRLISGSSNYSIPLDGQALLGLFSASNLDCASQNALITFDGASSKRDLIDVRAATSTDAGSPAVTSDGIVIASGSTPSATSTGSSASATSTNLVNNDDDATTRDFARVAVLYVLQDSGTLDTAATAQTDLQRYFRSGQTSTGNTADANDLPLGKGYTCDLSGHSVTVANGTTVGGQ